MVRFLQALAVCLCALFSFFLFLLVGKVVGDGVGRRWERRGWGGRWALFVLLFCCLS